MACWLDTLKGKSQRRLSYLWNILINPKNYLVPETIEDYKSKSFDISVPTIKIGSTVCYLSDRVQKECRDFADIIHAIPEIRETLTYSIVHRSILNEIEAEIPKRLEHLGLREFSVVLEDLSVKLLKERKEYVFFFAISGIELKDVAEINLGTSALFLFKQADGKGIIQNISAEAEDVSFTENIMKFLEKRFVDKVCIKCVSFGDAQKAEDLARAKGRQILNLWRFIACVLFHGQTPQNSMKINFTSETYTEREPVLGVEFSSGAFAFGWRYGRKPLQPLSISNSLLNDLKENVFLEDVGRILDASSRTEVETTVLTAIHWAGEAQNEFDNDVAFIKYWTALEAIFTGDSDNIAHTLAKGVSVLAAFGGYRFIEEKEVREVYQVIKRLYGIRSEIIHRGLGGNVTYSDLSSICKYTAWTILGLLHLRSIGYRKMIEIEKQTCRLFRIATPDLGN